MLLGGSKIFYIYMSLFRNKAELYNEKRKAKNDYKISST